MIDLLFIDFGKEMFLNLYLAPHFVPQKSTPVCSEVQTGPWRCITLLAFFVSNEFYILHYLRNLGNVSRRPAIHLLRPEDEGCQPPLVRDVKICRCTDSIVS